MPTIALVLAGLAALLHVGFFWMESIAFRRPAIHRRFGVKEPGDVDVLAFSMLNQGFYNLFLALGTLVGVVGSARGWDPQGSTLVSGVQGSSARKGSPTTRAILEQFGLIQHFHHVQGTDGFPCKPAPDVLFTALAAMGARPEDCLFVGDSAADMEAGRRAGVKTCAVTYGYGRRPDLAHFTQVNATLLPESAMDQFLIVRAPEPAGVEPAGKTHFKVVARRGRIELFD